MSISTATQAIELACSASKQLDSSDKQAIFDLQREIEADLQRVEFAITAKQQQVDVLVKGV